MAALYSFPNKASFDGWFDDYKVSGLAEMRHGLLDGQVTSYYSMAGGRCRLRCVDALRRGEQKIRERRSQGRLPNQLRIENQRYRRSNQWLHNQSWPVHPPEQREGFHQEDADDIQLTILIGFPSAEKRQAFHDIQSENGMKDVRERTLVGPLYNIDALPKDHPAFVSGSPFERKTM